ncbi:hypothetical protein [Pseudomonas sp.]|uniref:hypothetical protein n=1 Tax=Pseudomonas sp. TaxID=306 RepID=UPI001B255635|nr:hypothetical protein [Pseudomonas sp.]MBO9548513.1 hypothetical protein [Pseudomonas sp.]
MKYILVILALTVLWYIILLSVPRNKRGITNAICSIIFGCSMIGMVVHGSGN